MPDIVINDRMPIVFNATVFPPMFGPVTRSVVKFLPTSTLRGTTFLLNSRSGCLPLIISNTSPPT